MPRGASPIIVPQYAVEVFQIPEDQLLVLPFHGLAQKTTNFTWFGGVPLPSVHAAIAFGEVHRVPSICCGDANFGSSLRTARAAGAVPYALHAARSLTPCAQGL